MEGADRAVAEPPLTAFTDAGLRRPKDVEKGNPTDSIVNAAAQRVLLARTADGVHYRLVTRIAEGTCTEPGLAALGDEVGVVQRPRLARFSDGSIRMVGRHRHRRGGPAGISVTKDGSEWLFQNAFDIGNGAYSDVAELSSRRTLVCTYGNGKDVYDYRFDAIVRRCVASLLADIVEDRRNRVADNDPCRQRPMRGARDATRM